jgi:hypothetical protein
MDELHFKPTRSSISIDAKSPKRVSRILCLGNAVKASTVDHAQTDRRTFVGSKGTITVTAS